MQQALRVICLCFGVFVCFGANYRSWQTEILQERAEGCMTSKRKSVKTSIFILWFCRGVVFGH